MLKPARSNDLEQSQLLNKAMNIEVLTTDEINQLIIAGLELSFREFVNGLYTPNISRRSFMPKEMLLPALAQINSWSNFLTDDEQKNLKKETLFLTCKKN